MPRPVACATITGPQLMILDSLGDWAERVRRAVNGYARLLEAPTAASVLIAGARTAKEAESVLADVPRTGARWTLPTMLLVKDDRTARAAVAGGAAGVVGFDESDDAVRAAVFALHAGLAVQSRRFGSSSADPLFTPRQKQVLALVTLGFSNAEIAARLVVGEATVKTHLSAVYAKLGVRSRAAAVRRITDPDGGLGAGVLELGLDVTRLRGSSSAATDYDSTTRE